MPNKRPIYVIVTPFFPSAENWRGAYCYDFAKAVINDGRYDVRVFVPGDGGTYEYQGIHVKTFKQLMLPSCIFPFLFVKINTCNFIRALDEEDVEICNIKVCHAHTALYSVYPLVIKKKNSACLTLLHHHDPQSFGLNMGVLRNFWLYNLIEYPILRERHEKIDIHVFISNMVKNSFLKVPDASWTNYIEYRKQMRGLGFYDSVKIKRSIILHNGVDTSKFKINEKQEIGKRNDVFTIGCIGNFCDWKDQITLLKALLIIKNKHKKINARLIGSGQFLEKCKKFVKKNEMEMMVTFEKECDHSQLPDFYRNIDLFVLPSFFEGFGCVFTEAAACGIPFITCEGQGMDDLIDPLERKYWLAKQCSSDDLSSKILYYIENRLSLKQHLNGEIDINKLVPKFLNVINSL